MAREVIEPPSVKRVLLSERRQELLLQIEFENKFPKKRCRAINESGITAKDWKGFCKLRKVGVKGSIPEMQERLRLEGYEYFSDVTGKIHERCLDVDSKDTDVMPATQTPVI